jgi:hypothetical protein
LLPRPRFCYDSKTALNLPQYRRSTDGIAFTPMFDRPVVDGSDTQNTIIYDHFTKQYAGYIRIDNPIPHEHPSNENRPLAGQPVHRIGRCDLGTNLGPPWPCNLTVAEVVMTFEPSDPACMVSLRPFA